MPLLPEYLKILVNAQSKRKENRDFLARLKKEKPRDLDQVTNELHDTAFKHIDCLKCANCCTTTGPLLKTNDIDRAAAAIKLKPTQFSEKFLRMDEDGDMVFKSMPCPFLNSDNYCSIYSARPNACREYPHTQMRDIAQKLPITFSNSMICPAVAEVVEGLKKHYNKKAPVVNKRLKK
jgi:Fe-S-cluster containining protein